MAYDTASRAYNKAVRDRNYFQQYGTAQGLQHKQVVIRMRQLPLVLSASSKPKQVITKHKDYNDAIANAASELEKAQGVLNQTVIVSDN